MKYFGKKSLSSVISVILNLAWWVVIAMSIFAVVVFAIMLFSRPGGNSFATEIGTWSNDNSWKEMYSWPLIGKILILPYFGVVVVFLLQIIKKAQQLFNNFKNDLVFNKSNVMLISKISKLLIVFSILTFNFSSLLVSVLLFMICEIFKKGPHFRKSMILRYSEGNI
jgi:hypothetical protein